MRGVNDNYGGGGDTIEVTGASKGGRRIRIRMQRKHLHRFRAVWVPPVIMDARLWGSKHKATEWASYQNSENRKDVEKRLKEEI